MSRVRGWCPSAHRPMRSGDGLLVRVRPRMGRMSRDGLRHLCVLAAEYGNGMIDLTSRGNLQLRGVSQEDHPALLSDLIAAGLVAADPAAELAATVTPFPDAEGLTEAVVAALEAVAPDLPDLPGKMGFAADTGAVRWLTDISGDFRIERAASGLVLRADGAARGRPVTPAGLGGAVTEMADWFLAAGGASAGRLRRLLRTTDLPPGWQSIAPVATAGSRPGPDPRLGRVGVAFGQMNACEIKAFLDISDVKNVTITPWRMLIFTDASGAPVDVSHLLSIEPRPVSAPGALITDSADPLLRMTACPGAPACGQASVETRGLARRLAGHAAEEVHVSGCEKSCAKRGASPVTLVGRAGLFDIVRQGAASDRPVLSAQTEAQVIAYLGDAPDASDRTRTRTVDTAGS